MSTSVLLEGLGVPGVGADRRVADDAIVEAPLPLLIRSREGRISGLKRGSAWAH